MSSKGKPRPTRADVARRARVSEATVSYVVNDGPRPVAAETRQRVLDAIHALGYRPSDVARSLRLQRTRTIGLIFPDAATPFYAALARGVEDGVFALGHSVLLCNSNYEQARERAYADVLIRKQVDAWASQRILGMPRGSLADYHRASSAKALDLSRKHALMSR